MPDSETGALLPLKVYYWNDKVLQNHYENTPIQIYWKFNNQKMKLSDKKVLIFFIFLLKT